MPFSDCCGVWFIVRLPLLHTKHLPLRFSCTLWQSLPKKLTTPHCAHCLHLAHHVGFCPLELWLVLPTQLEQDRSIPFKWVGELPVSKTPLGLDSAGLFGRFMPAYLSLKLCNVGHPPSNLRLYYLPHASYLCDQACAHRVHVDCYLFTESSSCRRSFFDWATPVKLCSIVSCMIIDCLLHQYLGSIQKGDIECMLSTSWNSRWSTCVLACWLSRLLRAGFATFMKRCCTISWPCFTSSAPTRRSCIIFSKSTRESHTLPPAKLLQQNSTDLASDWFPLAVGFWCHIIGPLVIWCFLASRSLELRKSLFQFNPLCVHRWGAFEFLDTRCATSFYWLIDCCFYYVKHYFSTLAWGSM